MEDFLPPPPSTWFCGIWYRPERPNTYNQSQSRRAERSTRLRTWIFRSQSKIGWFLTWIEKKRFSTSDYVGFGFGLTPILQYSWISPQRPPWGQKKVDVVVRGLNKSQCMYCLPKTWPLVRVRGLSWPLILSQSTPTVQGACLHIYGSL